MIVFAGVQHQFRFSLFELYILVVVPWLPHIITGDCGEMGPWRQMRNGMIILGWPVGHHIYHLIPGD